MKITLSLLFATVLVGCAPPSVQKLWELEEAITSQDSAKLQRFLESTNAANMYLPLRGPGQFTYPIIVAANLGDTNAVYSLIKAGANVNAKDSEGRTALIATMISDKRPNGLQCAEMLIGAGADVNLSDREQVTALRFAAAYRDERFLKLLLKAGANPDKVDIVGDTPLHEARSVTNAQLLVEAGANVRITNIHGRSAAEVARQNNRNDIASWLESVSNSPNNRN